MKTSTRRPLAALALVALAAGTLTACGGGEPAEFDTPQETATTASSTPAESGDDTQAGADEAEAGDTAGTSSATTIDDEGAIATMVYPLPGADERDEATVTVGVQSLEVDGQVMRLELSFTPEFRGDGAYNIFQMNAGHRLTTVLNDRENLKQYTVLEQGTPWATSTGPTDPRVGSGDTLRYWAYFAAPEDDIDSIGVAIPMGEFDDVAITR